MILIFHFTYYSMYRKIWKECHRSVGAIHFLSSNGTCITTFTGFKVRDYLITNDEIEKFAKPDSVEISFTEDSDFSVRKFRQFTYDEFNRRVLRPGDKKFPGYAIISLKETEFADIPSLHCSRKIDYAIGHPIAILGYQLDQENLTVKSGIISSFYTDPDGFNYIQVDCSVAQGNAGSPLIDAESMEVIGVVGHQLAVLARSHREMMKIFNRNLNILKEIEGQVNVQDVDPIQVLIANQNQIKRLAADFYKTANMRVGYAAELCSLVDYCPEEDTIADFEIRPGE